MLFFDVLSSLSANTSFERAQTPKTPEEFYVWALNWRDFQNKVCSNLVLFPQFPRSPLCPLFEDCDNRQCHFVHLRESDTFKSSPCDMLADADDGLFSLTGVFKMENFRHALWKCSPSFTVDLDGTHLICDALRVPKSFLSCFCS